jgi:ankyrin repeat protein
MIIGLKDINREILKHVDDKSLLEICTVDKKTWNEVCDDNFLRRRLSKYPNIEKYKRSDESWKRFFLRAIYYISLMKEKFEYNYSSGSFFNQYHILQGTEDLNNILVLASSSDQLPLLIYALAKGADIHYSNDEALRHAIYYGNFDIVKYLVEHGANIYAKSGTPFSPLNITKEKGNREIIKYLESRM